MSRLQGRPEVPRLTLLADYREEHWPSMEYVGEMLAEGLAERFPAQLAVRRWRPAFAAPFRRLTRHRGVTASNADRALNRYLAYPAALTAQALRPAARHGFWHVEDHSYAHLALVTPAARTGVFVHDLDAVRCVFAPAAAPRGAAYRRIAATLLAGIERAAVLFHSTAAVKAEMDAAGIGRRAVHVHAPYGYAREFAADGPAQRLPDGAPYLLHVGSCIPRKRIDVLLAAFAAARARLPGLQLVKVGGEWTAAQRAQLEALGLSGSLHHLRDLNRTSLAGWYRGAAAVLLPSEGEGFGLPVIEAFACGAPVIASDLPVLREVAADAACFVPVGDAAAFAERAVALVQGGAVGADRAARLAVAARYSWARHAEVVGEAYLALGAQGSARRD